MKTVKKSTEIRSLRDRLGMTQVEFARLLGVAANTVARWERGELGLSHSTLKLFSVLKGWSSPSEVKRQLRAAAKRSGAGK
jgi:DNA-binding transcriptional regulator YiaG